jgi:hypothetical protein
VFGPSFASSHRAGGLHGLVNNRLDWRCRAQKRERGAGLCVEREASQGCACFASSFRPCLCARFVCCRGSTG